MGKNFDRVPDNIKEHIKRITLGSIEGDRDEYIEAVSEGWLEKMNHFDKETELVEMEQTEVYEIDNPNGALIITYSGSLLKIGPLTDEGRNVEYTSIGLRTDVPEKAEKKESELAGDVELDGVVEFITGPIKKSSPVYAIAVMKEAVELEEQEEKLAEVTQILSDDFLQVNKTIILDESEEEISLV